MCPPADLTDVSILPSLLQCSLFSLFLKKENVRDATTAVPYQLQGPHSLGRPTLCPTSNCRKNLEASLPCPPTRPH